MIQAGVDGSLDCTPPSFNDQVPSQSFMPGERRCSICRLLLRNVDMNLHQLRIFCRVVEYGSYTRAADTLYMTQPAVSLQVRALERSL
jgi:Bacterial regulatory helix-turn-helix protein, lysR family